MDAFIAISLAMFTNLLAVTYSPKMRLMHEKAPSTLHLYQNLCILDHAFGKTTYMLQVMASLPLPPSTKIFLNGEDVNLEGIAADQLDGLEETAFRVYRPDRTKQVCLFIDEVQNLPSWARWVRTLHDSHMYRLVVSGSTSELSAERLPSALRGRALNTLVLPFSFKELLRTKGVEPGSFMQPSRVGELASLADEYLEFGGYPNVVLSKDALTRLTILHEIFESVVQRDIIEKEGVKRPRVLKVFMNAVLGSVQRPLSARSIARWLGSQGIKVGRQTAINYLDGAESVFLPMRAYPYSRKPRERRVNPKLYVVDSGFLSLIGADASKKLENQVMVELVRRGSQISYWRSDSIKREVDFVVERGRRLGLVQVSYTPAEPATYSRAVDALLEASDALGTDELTVITKGEERVLSERSKRIDVIPAWSGSFRASRSRPSLASLDERHRHGSPYNSAGPKFNGG